jgi:hypothetical protein
LNLDDKQTLPLPDKNIPASVMIIGSFEIAISLLGLIILVLSGNFDGGSAAFLILVTVYGAMGAGLLAIQEWARRTNVILHIVAVPYTFYTTFILGGPSGWRFILQLLISLGIIWALTRPEIQYKFQTVVPKQKIH